MKTTILFLRHEEHGVDGTIKQELPMAARERARARGRKLREWVPVPQIDAAYSSPQPRAYCTVVETLIGHGALMPIRTDDRLGDMAMGGIDPAPLKAKAKELGIEPEELCLDPYKVSEEFAAVMLKRAYEGAQALRDIAAKHPGQTVIVGSHGGSRMEVSIMGLKHPGYETFAGMNQESAHIIDRGQIVQLLIDSATGELLEKEYL